MAYSTALTTVTGLAEVQHMLEQAPALVVATAYHRALSAAGFTFLKELVVQAPERDDDNTRPEDQRPLREYAEMYVTLDSQFRGGMVDVGFSGFGGRIANWLQNGHWAVNVHKGGFYIDDKGRKRAGKRVKFVPPNQFMTRTADIAGNAAVQAFQDAMVEALREVL